jgi:hypothetical protein
MPLHILVFVSVRIFLVWLKLWRQKIAESTAHFTRLEKAKMICTSLIGHCLAPSNVTKGVFGSMKFKIFFIYKYIKIIYFLFFKNYF